MPQYPRINSSFPERAFNHSESLVQANHQKFLGRSFSKLTWIHNSIFPPLLAYCRSIKSCERWSVLRIDVFFCTLLPFYLLARISTDFFIFKPNIPLALQYNTNTLWMLNMCLFKEKKQCIYITREIWVKEKKIQKK